MDGMLAVAMTIFKDTALSAYITVYFTQDLLRSNKDTEDQQKIGA